MRAAVRNPPSVNGYKMSMTITLELSPDAEAQLREGVAHQDAERVRQVLTGVLTPTVEALLQQPPAPLSEEGFDELADQLADAFAAYLPPNAPLLSDYAVSREGIYEGHA